MKTLQFALVMALVLGAGMATAQENKPKEKTVPWWKLGDTPAKAQQLLTKEKPAPPAVKQVAKVVPAQAKQPERPRVAPPAVRRDIKPEPRERVVYRLAHAPARDVAKTITELLRSEGAVDGGAKNTVILADAVTNCVVVSGSPEAVHETVKLIEQLDAEPLMVCVQVVIGLVESREGLSLLAPNAEGPELSCSHAEACELIEQFSKSDAVKILARPQLMTLGNQAAFLQVGQRTPRVTQLKEGKAVGTTLENVGLIVGLTPRITPEKVVIMELDVEKSELGPEDQGIPIGVDAEGNVLRSPKVETIILQTTVKIPPSRAVIIGGLALKDGNDGGELVIVVTPHVVDRRK